MKLLRAVFLLLGFFPMSAAVCLAASQDVSVRSYVNSASVFIGDKITYSLVITGPKGAAFEFPDFKAVFKDFELISSGRKESILFNRSKISAKVEMRSYSPGIYEIPAQVVKYSLNASGEKKEAATAGLRIEVKSGLSSSGSVTDIADIKGPLGPGSISARILILVLALFVIFAAVFAIIRSVKRKIPPDPVIKPWEAHEKAYSRLEELRRKDLLGKDMVKQYYSELSGILRNYLEDRFGLKAPEMTTEEFISYVRQYAQLESRHKDILKDFLSLCDLVKFARHVPDMNYGVSAFDTCKNFVDQTKAREPSPGADKKG